MTALAITTTPGQTDIARAGIAAMEAYVAAGDIERLAPRERVALYRAVCDSLGLNPLTLPFQYLRLSGKTILYATKSCTEQLRQIHGVSVLRMDRNVAGDLLTITVSVRDRTGREDISTGVVSLAGLKGDALANQAMKAETKAKRRATLSICGLAMLDETEVETIPGASPVSVDEIHAEASEAPARAAARGGGKARNPIPSAAEREALLDPVPAAQRPCRAVRSEPEAAEPSPAPEASTGDPAASLEPVEIVIDPATPISRVRPGLYRVEHPDAPRLRIVDEAVASMLDAQQAFKVSTRVALAWATDPRGRIATVERVIGDEPKGGAR